MRTLSLDDLDQVGGGLQLGLLPQLNQTTQFANPIPQQGLGLIPQGYPVLGYDPGFGHGLGEIGQIVNQLVHTPLVANLIGQISQQNPQIGGMIQGALGALTTGNIGALAPLAQQFIGSLQGGQFGGNPLGGPFFKP
jgi:hypothetical protein